MAISVSKQATSRQRLAQETALLVEVQQHKQRQTQLHEVQQATAQLQRQQERRHASDQARVQILRYAQLLEQLSELVPTGLWLTTLADEEQGISISGLSHDYADIVQFSNQLENVVLLSTVRLAQARQDQTSALSEGEVSPLFFQLQADWRAKATTLVQHE